MDANMFDYIIWRGDLTIEQSPFNAADGLILACLSYNYFDNILAQYSGEGVSVRDAARLMREMPEDDLHYRDPQDIVLLQLAGKSKRFGAMKLCYYVDHVDIKKEAQFSAVTVLLGDGSVFAAIRGTDMTMAGWKEDFNMSFLEFVPAQRAAAAYILYVSRKTEGSIYIGGHSKGGNLAVFAAAVMPSAVKERIVSVLDFDSPGFQEGMLRFSGYREVLPKISTYVPENSIIGMLMGRGGRYTVVKSDEKGIFQHDPYSWNIRGNDFVKTKRITKNSEFWSRTFKSWLKNLNNEKREKFVDSLFDVLSVKNIDERGEIILTPKAAYNTIQAMLDEDDETRGIIFDGLSLLWEAAKNTAGEYGGELTANKTDDKSKEAR